jgi:glycosylphosphatidylinositol transamidase
VNQNFLKCPKALENGQYKIVFYFLFFQINGRLPNLDLVNLMILLTEKFGVSPTLYNTVHHPTMARQHYDYATALLSLSRSVFYQSFVEYEGLHSIIGGYGVNAVTIQARHTRRGGSGTSSQVATGRERDNGREQMNEIDSVEMVKIAEGGLRSLNNVLEKLHQSYFLYFLTHPHKFIRWVFVKLYILRLYMCSRGSRKKYALVPPVDFFCKKL